MAGRIEQSPTIKVDSLDKLSQGPYSSTYHEKFSKNEINMIGKKGREELKKILHDVHGAKPIFEYPVLSFERENERANVSVVPRFLPSSLI